MWYKLRYFLAFIAIIIVVGIGTFVGSISADHFERIVLGAYVVLCSGGVLNSLQEKRIFSRTPSKAKGNAETAT